MGYIYILTNPSFPDYVKIGYADDVKQRLANLNRTECTPFAFRVYATYKVNARLTDMKIHNVIDRLNPDLRSIDTVNGKKRIREFYAISAEDAYSLFEAIAQINGLEKNLKKWPQTDKEKEEEKTAKEVEVESAERRAPFKFSMVGINVGEEVEFSRQNNKYNGTKCKVVDDNHVEYNGETWAMSPLAAFFTGRTTNVQGTVYFKYNGEWLNDIRQRFEKRTR